MDTFEAEVLQRLTRIEGKVDSELERIEDIEHDLYGNGRVGLLAEHIQLRTEVDERTDPKRAGALGGALGTIFMAILAYVARELGI